ncbi:MAG: hypothetical protein JXR96_09155 [Deltaproteobacteria bacterium]|nr:hypothetical protein [Deltaproteobacteria bacterium]
MRKTGTGRQLLFTILLAVALSAFAAGCPKRDQPPPTAYDPELLAAAQQAAEEDAAAQNDAGPSSNAAKAKPECDRERGGCAEGFLCWDSWYCKRGLEDQCSAAGDKRCHKRCETDADCPADTPRCVEKPIFNGSERGILERFCVSGE